MRLAVQEGSIIPSRQSAVGSAGCSLSDDRFSYPLLYPNVYEESVLEFYETFENLK